MDILSYILGKKAGGGGGEAVLVNKNIDANGTYNASADSADGYKKVTVDVPNTYAAGDEGKVVSNGALVGQTSESYTQNGTYDTTLVSEVEVDVPMPATECDVNFYDYDGTILYSYTAADFANLSALPANPSHAGLTAEGWNWTLAGAKAFVSTYGKLNIGQQYAVDGADGRIVITTDAPNMTMTIVGMFNRTSGAYIDWGDGNTTNALVNRQTYTHVYAEEGEHQIKFHTGSGTFKLSGSNDTNTWFGGRGNNVNGVPKVTEINFTGKLIADAEPPKNSVFLTKASYADSSADVHLENCPVLKNVIVPKATPKVYVLQSPQTLIIFPESTAEKNLYLLNNVAGTIYLNGSITIKKDDNNGGFRGCKALLSTYSANITGVVPQYGCGEADALSYIGFAEGLTGLKNNACRNSNSLEKITIPSTVTGMGNYLFNGCNALTEVHMKPTTPPTLSASGAFPTGNTGFKIYVPYSADHSVLTAYQTNTNWSTYTSYMQEEAQ